VEHSPFLKKIATYQSVSQREGKTNTGQSPKIALKRRVSPLKIKNSFNFNSNIDFKSNNEIKPIRIRIENK
jgi:hypothetical protein